MRSITIACLSTALLLSGCAESEPDSSAAATPAESGETMAPPAWLLASVPASPVDVGEAKAEVQEGQSITIRGRIGGRMDPLSNERAQFVIVDPAIPSCADLEHDGCPTPWDYCCQSPTSMQANTATIVLVDENDTPREVDLRSMGFEPLDEVVVVGIVGSRPVPEVLVVRATEIYKAGG